MPDSVNRARKDPTVSGTLVRILDRFTGTEPFADTRLRIAGLTVLAFCFSSLHQPAALAAMVALTAVVALVYGAEPGQLLRRLRLPGVVVVALVALLPFASGHSVVASLGPLDATREGLAAAAGIALRFLCIFALVFAMIGRLPPSRLVAALRALGLPALIADMAMLVLRHMADLRDDFARMRTAMRLRGSPNGFWRGQFKATGWSLASLVLRSHARSERVYHAMILRGHGAPGAAAPVVFVPRKADLVVFAVLVAGGAGLVLMDRLS